MFLIEQETYEAICRIYKKTLALKKPEDNISNVRDLTRSESLDFSKQPYHHVLFLELVTSSHVTSHPEEYVVCESKNTCFMRSENNLDLGGGVYLAAGASKTVACIERPRNKRAAAVIIDALSCCQCQTFRSY
uniref:Uncharacterized protein n=1 Tax=Panagrolaimus davidi TaxID=227884 RepID=A0A914Q8Z1_9BILA